MLENFDTLESDIKGEKDHFNAEAKKAGESILELKNSTVDEYKTATKNLEAQEQSQSSN